MELTTPLAPLYIRTATPSSVRAVNRSIMLDLIRRHQPISRAGLARLTGIFRSSVSDIVEELLAQGLVAEAKDKGQRSRGRAPISLRLNESTMQVLGLNIRPVYSQLAYAGLSGRIQETLEFETPTSPKKLVGAIGTAIARMGHRLGGRSRNYHGIGIAVPGHVDAAAGRIVWTPTHEELSQFPLTEEIERETGIPALADNDCNLGALSELWFASEATSGRNSDFVFLNVSDYGVGAGAVINGEIYLGHDARFAAEVGHMVVEPYGLKCSCGRSGCWEMYIRNEATWKRVHPRLPFSGERCDELFASAESDKRTLEALKETARYLSLGVSNISFLFNPAEIVLAGRITAAWNLIREDVMNAYRSPHVFCKVRPARLSADNSLLHGAVCLALRETFAGPKFGQR
jgi:predicted NBD/HSP70 family sugar kinase